MDYNKLVRDKIPDIIKQNNEIPFTHTADDEEYKEKLYEKLKEEVDEFIESDTAEELADILEVLREICDIKGVSMRNLDSLRKKKRKERGGFDKRIILERKEIPDSVDSE